MNRKYLEYLIKQRKTACLFFGLLVCAISLSPFITRNIDSWVINLNTTMETAFVLGTVFTFVLPAVLLAWVHRRRSADLYLALPVKRKDLLITTTVFIALLSWIYFLIPTAIAVLLSRSGLQMWLVCSVFALFFYTVMTLFNSMLYLIANNIFDGIVMMGAYSLLPVAVFGVISAFLDICVAGLRSTDLPVTVMRWLSPTGLGAMIYNNLLAASMNRPLAFKAGYFIALVAYGLLASYVLKAEFIDRQSERAEQVSDRFFSYPLVINLYALCILIVLSAGRLSLQYLRNHLIWYLILLLIYIVAMFIYRRRIQVRLKDLGVFLAGILLSFALSAAAWGTRGFGLADSYRLEEGDTLVYSYWATVDMYDLTNREQTEDFWSHYADVSVEVQLPVPLKEQDQPVIGFMEEKRRDAINRFYEGDEIHYNGWLQIYNQRGIGEKTEDFNYWQYNMKTLFTEEELKQLAEYGTVTVYAPEINDGEPLSLEEFLEAREAYIHDHE